MKDKRAIIIKDTRLRKIRDGLRNLLIMAINERVSKLIYEQQSLMNTLERGTRSINNLSTDDLKEYKKAQADEEELKFKLSRSILTCVLCGKSNRDMIYNKTYEAWYCNFCYCLGLASAREYFEVSPNIRLPEDHPFLNEEYLNVNNILLTETDIFIDSYIIENLMMYDRDIDKEDIKKEFYKLPKEHQMLWILEYWLTNPDFSKNLKRFNKKKNEVKKKPSDYKYNTYFSRVRELGIKKTHSGIKKESSKSKDEVAIENHYKTFI